MGKNIKQYMISAACCWHARHLQVRIFMGYLRLRKKTLRISISIFMATAFLNLSICQQLHTGHGEMEIKVLS